MVSCTLLFACNTVCHWSLSCRSTRALWDYEWITLLLILFLVSFHLSSSLCEWSDCFCLFSVSLLFLLQAFCLLSICLSQGLMVNLETCRTLPTGSFSHAHIPVFLLNLSYFFMFNLAFNHTGDKQVYSSHRQSFPFSSITA